MKYSMEGISCFTTIMRKFRRSGAECLVASLALVSLTVTRPETSAANMIRHQQLFFRDCTMRTPRDGS